MPANLNALIRYKTIDRLLGTGRKYTIHELMEHCTDALAETRGMDRMVSKRTIQDDIRVLRSDILGFNAPIENRSGYYYYSLPGYSIFETRISNIDILKRVFTFLFSLRKEVENDHLDQLLADIGQLITVEKSDRNERMDYMPLGFENMHESEECLDLTEEEPPTIRLRIGKPVHEELHSSTEKTSVLYLFSWDRVKAIFAP